MRASWPYCAPSELRPHQAHPLGVVVVALVVVDERVNARHQRQVDLTGKLVPLDGHSPQATHYPGHELVICSKPVRLHTL